MTHLLVDCHYLMHRIMNVPVFTRLVRSDGMLTGGVYGFLKNLHSVLLEFPSIDRCSVVLDAGYSNRRKALHPAYKSNRNRDAETEEGQLYRRSFRSQRTYLKYALSKLGCRIIEVEGREADDIIYWIAATSEGKKLVLSDDKDMLQNVREDTNVYRPLAGEVVTVANFEELTTYPREAYLLARSMVGDPADCIEGLKGVGPKRASALVHEAGTLDALIEYCSKGKLSFMKKVAVSRDILELNLELLDLSKEEFSDGELTAIIDTLDRPATLEVSKIADFFHRMEFRSFFSSGATSADELSHWLSPFHLLR